ncbi:serine hydrolase [Pleurocapsales cyanobacterium LEGE 06147]|nr:serine hydrolase [Pleurocapsales cyanobacterium LEGE 06147]
MFRFEQRTDVNALPVQAPDVNQEIIGGIVMKRIAVLGSGAMGSRIVQNLLNAKYQVVVYNRTADKVKPLLNQGAVYAATPREAAEQADIAIGMVTDNDVSRSVWLDPETGAALGLGKDAFTSGGAKPIAIESSTLTDFPVDTSVTLRQLLSHTSGLPDYGGVPGYSEAVKAHPSSPWSTEAFLDLVCTQGLQFAPGKGWAYSNIGYLLVNAPLMTLRVHKRLLSPSINGRVDQAFSVLAGDFCPYQTRCDFS